MTREEARQIMSIWLVSSKGAKGQLGYIEGWFDEEDAEAFRMAIEALSAVCDDCIWNVCNYNKVDWDVPSAEAVHKPDYSYEADMVRRLKEALSADRPTGEWVTLERDENVYDIYGVPTWGVNYMCDKCGFITTAIQDHFGQYKFCPNCGAKMGGNNHD